MRHPVEAAVETNRPRLELSTVADKDGLPLVRQALRGLGLAVAADPEGLHDAELALTEACSNVIRHAYADGRGTLAVSIEARPGWIHALVRDHGCGMTARDLGPQTVGGLGLRVIDSVVDEVAIRTEPGMGTEVEMDLTVANAAQHRSRSAIESVLRRLVATAAAQCDMAPGRISETLMVTEVVAREAPARVVGNAVELRVGRDERGVEVLLGPLAPGGARDIVAASRVPVVGSIVERLADAIWEVPPETGRPCDGEALGLRFER